LTALSEALERSGWEIPIEAADPIAGTVALEA